MKHDKPQQTQFGFTLVEIAIVLLIITLLMAGLVPTISSQIEQQRRGETRKQIAEIQQALLGFAIINGRLPCPIDPLVIDPANASYGQEAGSCSVVPGAEGYLPWKSLGVLETDAWGTKRSNAASPWNGYWRYRVDRNFASAVAITTNVADTLKIFDSESHQLTSNSEAPIAIVFSTGPDLIGNGQNAVASFDTSYQSDVPGAGFDDILVWISRPQLFNRLVSAGKLP
jgi:prepilin-type N-terminal cleavage/methylation domain-containing protein